jgi:hypothetical protein
VYSTVAFIYKICICNKKKSRKSVADKKKSRKKRRAEKQEQKCTVNVEAFARQHIYESINLRGWRPWRPVRVEQPNPQLHQSEQPFRAIQATAGGEQRPAPASVFQLSVQPFCSQGAPTGALIPSNRCLHDDCEVGWRAGRDQWNLGMGQQALHQAH